MSDYVKSTNFASKDSLASGNPLKIVKGTEIDTEFNSIATAVATKADLVSPALTGTPTAPTATGGTNTTQVATTAFVTSAVATAASTAASTYAPLASPALTGTPTAPTAAAGTNTTQIATTAFVTSILNSPALTGTPTAPTAAAGTNTTQIATTAFVTAGLQAAYPVGSIYMNASSSTNPATLFGFGTWVAFGAGRMPVGFSSGDALFGTVGNTGGSRDATLPSHTHTITDPGHSHAPPSGLTGPWLSNPFSGDGSIDSSTTSGPNERNSTTGNTQSATTGISVNSAGTSATNANLPPYITVYMWQRTA